MQSTARLSTNRLWLVNLVADRLTGLRATSSSADVIWWATREENPPLGRVEWGETCVQGPRGSVLFPVHQLDGNRCDTVNIVLGDIKLFSLSCIIEWMDCVHIICVHVPMWKCRVNEFLSVRLNLIVWTAPLKSTLYYFVTRTCSFLLSSDLNLILYKKVFLRSLLIYITLVVYVLGRKWIGSVLVRNEYSNRKHETKGHQTPSLWDRVQELQVPHHGPPDRPNDAKLHPGTYLFSLYISYELEFVVSFLPFSCQGLRLCRVRDCSFGYT